MTRGNFGTKYNKNKNKKNKKAPTKLYRHTPTYSNIFQLTPTYSNKPKLYQHTPTSLNCTNKPKLYQQHVNTAISSNPNNKERLSVCCVSPLITPDPPDR